MIYLMTVYSECLFRVNADNFLSGSAIDCFLPDTFAQDTRYMHGKLHSHFRQDGNRVENNNLEKEANLKELKFSENLGPD